MTYEKRAQVDFEPVPCWGHKAQVGHKSENYLFPDKALISFVFITKGHKAQDKEGGQPQKEKGGKMAQKDGKREKNRKYKQNRKHLCLVPFPLSGALA